MRKRRLLPSVSGEMGAFVIAAILMAIGLMAISAAGGPLASVGADPRVASQLTASFMFALAVIAFTSVSRDMQISLQTMMLYFAIFLILPGYSHAARQDYPFLSVPYSKSTQEQSSLMLLLFLLWAVGGYWVSKTFLGRRKRAPASSATPVVRANLILAAGLVAGSFLGMTIYAVTVGFDQLFALRGDLETSDVGTIGTGLFIVVPRMVCTVSMIYAIAIWRFTPRKRTGLLLIIANVLPCLITLWPGSVARSILFGTLLFGSMMFVNYAKPSRRLALSLLYLFGALVAMPLVDSLTRYGASISELSMSGALGAFFHTGDFDGLQSMNNAMLYVQINGYEQGRQVLSALFFFVPRGIWSGKAEPTGTVAAELAGYNFTNVSMPLPAEFYVDFGLAGVVVGGFVVGALLSWIDRYIDAHWSGDLKGRLVAGATVGYAIAIYRGTLIGVIAPTATLAVLIIIVNRWGLREARPQDAVRRRPAGPGLPGPGLPGPRRQGMPQPAPRPPAPPQPR
jgi:oligosaccharide repeat unit polymerase